MRLLSEPIEVTTKSLCTTIPYTMNVKTNQPSTGPRENLDSTRSHIPVRSDEPEKPSRSSTGADSTANKRRRAENHRTILAWQREL